MFVCYTFILVEKLGFEYELYDSPDGFFGSVNDKGQWNGMIQELIVGVSDVIAQS